MTLLELFVPRGTAGRKIRHLGERLVTQLVRADGAPAELIARARAMTQLIVHEPVAWSIGGQLLGKVERPRYLVRVSVPGGHLNERTRGELVERLTRVLAEVDDEPERLYQEPLAWVQILEVPDGSLGACGRVLATQEILRMVVDGRPPGPARRAEASQPAMAVDPVCGMDVVRDASAITLRREGTTYFFCNETCREIFARQH